MMPARAGSPADSAAVQKPELRMAASLPLSDRVYENRGNPAVVAAIQPWCRRILDIGCGAGDNAALLKAKFPECEISGITRSEKEADRARRFMKQCWVDDIEVDVPDGLKQEQFDCLIFSHVLEHLRNPGQVVARFSRLLREGGMVVVAVPNVLFFKCRLRFLQGRFEYEPAGGIMDDTHLHFYSYATADRYLLAHAPDLRVTGKSGHGNLPLGKLRGRLIPRRWAAALDAWGCRRWPNLFGGQTVFTAIRES